MFIDDRKRNEIDMLLNRSVSYSNYIGVRVFNAVDNLRSIEDTKKIDNIGNLSAGT